MPIHPWPHIFNRMKKNQPILGLDVGEKTIGLAISDPGWKQATPLHTLERQKLSLDMAQLAKLAKERDVAGYIIGLPVLMDGTETGSTERCRLFASQMDGLAALFPIRPEISFFDERLTTDAAEEMLRNEAGLDYEKIDTVIDTLAAQLILQGALDQYQILLREK